MNNETRNILIVVAVLALVGGAYYFGTTSKNTEQAAATPTTESTSTPAPATQPVKEQPVVKQSAPQPTTNNENAKVATTDELQACSNQAKILFDTHSSAIPSSMYDGTFTYKNHFNVSEGKCFSVETYNSSASFGQSLWDVYENNNIANYNLTSSNYPSGQCTMNGVYGCSKAQFSAYLNSEMESISY